MSDGQCSRRRASRPLITASVLAVLTMTGAACATEKAHVSQAYHAEVINQPVRVGAHSEITVRLTDAATGKPLTGAAISRSSLDMVMEGPPPLAGKRPPSRDAMTEQALFVEAAGPGLYRFIGDVSMAGTWALNMTATVPGQVQPALGRAEFKAR